MRRCLIVANQTLTNQTLSRTVKERVGAEPYQFHIVAPATPPKGLIADAGPQAPSLEDRAHALAAQRLDRGIDGLRALGAKVDGEVGDPDPVTAVLDALGRFPADEIVVSTLPRGLSQWLRRDVPSKLRKACDVPVTHVMAQD